ncbi:hypothetical protein ElyMa_002139200 [Elysia marginata]|uniref:Uncharacterized protein n=1 Tax=Elysia marginata TaxID=1093978 RepID=A0AAV4FJD7_9GAST|nr:hypothetical protein ElyMa_002139200 [Elysia marginata]
MPWLGIEPATSRSRVRRANHSTALPLYWYDYGEQLKRVNLRGRGKPVLFQDVIHKQAYKKSLPFSKAKKQTSRLSIQKKYIVNAWYELLSVSHTAKDLTPEKMQRVTCLICKI